MNAIELQGLTKRFGNFTAVDNLSFTVEKGQIFGFLGPNGSGKSTCIRMLCGLLDPSDGTALVNGKDIRKDPEGVKTSIGYMSQQFSLYKDLTVEENLDFFGSIYGLKGSKLAGRKKELVDLVGIEDYLDRRSGLLSGGWRQRLALAAALIHEPEVVFLDEPTAGIDPVARRDLWDLLFALSSQGKTLFVTTHYMDEAERCHEVAYIYLSKLMVIGSPSELKALPEVHPPATRRISIACTQPSISLAILKGQPYVLDSTLVEAEIHVLMQESVSDEEAVKPLKDAGVDVQAVRSIDPSLEDVFVTITRRLAKG